jgi:uncharacterized protein YceK
VNFLGGAPTRRRRGVAKFWWLILLVLVGTVAGCAVWVGVMHHAAQLERRRREQAAITAWADQQHTWFLAGDDRVMAYP